MHRIRPEKAQAQPLGWLRPVWGKIGALAK